jgi:hypothetical protein
MKGEKLDDEVAAGVICAMPDWRISWNTFVWRISWNTFV